MVHGTRWELPAYLANRYKGRPSWPRPTWPTGTRDGLLGHGGTRSWDAHRDAFVGDCAQILSVKHAGGSQRMWGVGRVGKHRAWDSAKAPNSNSHVRNLCKTAKEPSAVKEAKSHSQTTNGWAEISGNRATDPSDTQEEASSLTSVPPDETRVSIAADRTWSMHPL